MYASCAQWSVSRRVESYAILFNETTMVPTTEQSRTKRRRRHLKRYTHTQSYTRAHTHTPPNYPLVRVSGSARAEQVTPPSPQVLARESDKHGSIHDSIICRVQHHPSKLESLLHEQRAGGCSTSEDTPLSETDADPTKWHID